MYTKAQKQTEFDCPIETSSANTMMKTIHAQTDLPFTDSVARGVRK